MYFCFASLLPCKKHRLRLLLDTASQCTVTPKHVFLQMHILVVVSLKRLLVVGHSQWYFHHRFLTLTRYKCCHIIKYKDKIMNETMF
jgi:hypothetical protein